MPPKQGLRELKKARTRAAIQREALRLFRERGYEATTVEQVAQAAEVAHTTVFRYFPTKEDLVISDEADPLIFASLRAQPPELTPVQALRAAMLDVLGGFTPRTSPRDATGPSSSCRSPRCAAPRSPTSSTRCAR